MRKLRPKQFKRRGAPDHILEAAPRLSSHDGAARLVVRVFKSGFGTLPTFVLDITTARALYDYLGRWIDAYEESPPVRRGRNFWRSRGVVITQRRGARKAAKHGRQ